MMYSETTESKKFGRDECIKSVFLFLFNYAIFLAFIAFFIFFNTVYGADGGQSFAEYIQSNLSTLGYLAASVFILFVVIYFYYIFEDKSFLAMMKNIELVFVLLGAALVISYFFGVFFNVYARPAALLALLALMLLGRRDAILLNVVFALLMFSIDHFSNYDPGEAYETAAYCFPVMAFSAGMIGIFVGSKVKTRLRSFLTGFAVCLPVLIMASCIEYNKDEGIIVPLLYSLEGGVLSAVLFMALLPVFEVLFNCVTDYRLRELTDHDAPLMRELREKAMGTFNHCIVVAHLAEACAIALNEDTALARAAAYYHDVGKLRQPEYFTENQSGYNPHSELSPELSVDIIRSHAKDGYDLIRSKRLPKILADVAVQHHGTLPIKYFYAKALKMSDGELNIEDFSYPGPKPQTKIAAIIMIADASEAISRTLPERTPAKVENAVRDIIEERMDLDQFDECDITMRDLTTIKETIVSCLTGVYHSRIQYPKLKIKRTGGEETTNEKD